MRQVRRDIEVMNCVRNAGAAARAVEGTAAMNHLFQEYENERRESRTGRRSSDRRPSASRAEIIDFRNAAGYTIPEPAVNKQLSQHRRQSESKRARASRRRRNRLRHSVVMLTAGLLLGVIMTLAAGMITRASSVEEPVSYKYYDTVVVQYGESADDIIDRYMDPVHYASRESFAEEFCRINCLETDSAGNPLIHPGIHLIVPYFSEEILN